MNTFLGLSRGIDAVTGRLGRAVAWLIVAAALIAAGNAVVRKLFDTSSNAWSEVQWWLFSAVFLLAAPWTLSENEHIRIDIVSNLLSRRMRNWIEIIGHVVFLLPMAAVLFVTSWSYFVSAYANNEQALNAGGLPQWPIKALIPAAFALLFVQGLSELIKRIAIMRGDLTEVPHEHGYHDAVTEAAIEAMPPKK